MKGNLSTLFIVIFLASCSFGQKEKVNKIEEESVPNATFVTHEIKNIEKTKGPCAQDSTAKGCLTIDIQYPSIISGPSDSVLTSINEQIKKGIFDHAFVNEKPESFDNIIDEISSVYEEVLSDFPDYTSAWSLEIRSDIIYQSTKFISLATTIFSYTGGAHSNSFLAYRSYSLETGKPLKLTDFLIDDYEEKLSRSAEIEFRMNHEIPPNRNLSDAGFSFENDEFKLNDNFAIIDKSLIFYYNEYEISSYAQGPSELQLDLTDYADLIKPGSILDDQ